MQNVLITGGAGFIGSNFVRYLLKAEPDVHIVNLDVLTYAGSLENLKDIPDPERHVFVKGDICNRNLIADLMRRYSRYCRNYGNNELYRIAGGATNIDYDEVILKEPRARRAMQGFSLHYYTRLRNLSTNHSATKEIASSQDASLK